jgi:hypothetical protein
MARPRVKPRSGLATKVTGDVIRRHGGVRALWLAVQNDPELSVHDAAVEFYYAVGELLEGKTLEEIELRKIDRRRVVQHIKET